jgi:hypothetical protein
MGPLTQQRLGEALGLAVGARHVRAGAGNLLGDCAATLIAQAVDELVDVVGRLGGLAFVVDLEVLHLAPAALAALLLHVELKAVFDRVAEAA